MKRVIIILLDGVGVGEAPDADKYGDVGSNSVSNTAKKVGGLRLPNMGALGLGYVTPTEGVPPAEHPEGAYGRLQPKSAGKDSVTGHWELMGVYLEQPFPTYPNGFPQDVIDEFSKRTNLGVIGNKAASGTEIIKELGEEHLRTGKLIVYTSADSVFQIAAHEEVVPVEKLYEISKIAREMLVGEHGVGRVIARPFIGKTAEDFTRTNHRRDFPRIPHTDTMMDKLIASGRLVYSIGKIDDLFGGRGITNSNHTTDNKSSIEALYQTVPMEFEGLLFANLIEFDQIYGHRNDARGYADALESFDKALGEIRQQMHPTDIGMIVADHGVDPTTPSTDHSREYVPLLVFGEGVKQGVNLGTRGTLADVGATLAELFALEKPEIGESFLNQIMR